MGPGLALEELQGHHLFLLLLSTAQGLGFAQLPLVPSGVLSPLLTLLQSRETLNKAICVCQHGFPVSAGGGGNRALEGSQGLAATEERRKGGLLRNNRKPSKVWYCAP